MAEELETLLAQKLMLAFEGLMPPDYILEWLHTRSAAGFTLFRELNVDNLEQVRRLTTALQNAAHARNRQGLLIAADQEGGQLIALGGETTQFAGNMALGATGDPALAERIGQAIGRELAALGVNVNYAPVCDLLTNPTNPSLGIRSFSDRPELAAKMAGALVSGMQSSGVAATLKHFPGKGAAEVDSHFQLPVIQHDRHHLEAFELVPFKTGLEHGARLIMTGHFAFPALTGRADLPATLDKAVMTDLVRHELGFEGVIITDALDMGAITQGAGQIVDVIAAVRAGVDLLLLTADQEVQERVFAGLKLATSRMLINHRHLSPSATRLQQLLYWIRQFPQPELEVVGCSAHQELARELAERSVTLVRDDQALLPLHLPSDARVLVLVPETKNLTPADTSSYEQVNLAAALRRYQQGVEEIIFPHEPDAQQIAALIEHAKDFNLLILGTINAVMNPSQAALANQLLATRVPCITIALRIPYDLQSYPEAETYICTYSLQQTSLDALAAALYGEIPFRGNLPVALPGLNTREERVISL